MLGWQRTWMWASVRSHLLHIQMCHCIHVNYLYKVLTSKKWQCNLFICLDQSSYSIVRILGCAVLFFLPYDIKWQHESYYSQPKVSQQLTFLGEENDIERTPTTNQFYHKKANKQNPLTLWLSYVCQRIFCVCVGGGGYVPELGE